MSVREHRTGSLVVVPKTLRLQFKELQFLNEGLGLESIRRANVSSMRFVPSTPQSELALWYPCNVPAFVFRSSHSLAP